MAVAGQVANPPPPGGVRAANAHDAQLMHQQRRKKKKKYTLVLDLDETLVHTTDKPLSSYDCRVEIRTKKANRVFYILKRPFLDHFLVTLSHYFELVIFTASIRRYADAVIDLIDVHGVIERRFFRQSCIKGAGGSFLKDLRVLNGADLRRTCLVDNSPVAYSLQEENGLPIATWYDDQNDTALRDLVPFLLALRAVDDIRPLLFRRHLLQEAAMRSTRAKHSQAAQLARASVLPAPAPGDAPQLSVASALIEADERDDEDVQARGGGARRRVHNTL